MKRICNWRPSIRKHPGWRCWTMETPVRLRFGMNWSIFKNNKHRIHWKRVIVSCKWPLDQDLNVHPEYGYECNNKTWEALLFRRPTGQKYVHDTNPQETHRHTHRKTFSENFIDFPLPFQIYIYAILVKSLHRCHPFLAIFLFIEHHPSIFSFFHPIVVEHKKRVTIKWLEEGENVVSLYLWVKDKNVGKIFLRPFKLVNRFQVP